MCQIFILSILIKKKFLAIIGVTILLVFIHLSFPYLVQAQDEIPPVIDSNSYFPENGKLIGNSAPTISTEYSDNGGSGIDVNTVVITVDSVDKTSEAIITTSKVSYTPSSSLAAGSHTVTVDVSDIAGNPADQASWSFTVDNWSVDISSLSDSFSLDPNSNPTTITTSTITVTGQGTFYTITAQVNSQLTHTGGSGITLSAFNDGSTTASWGSAINKFGYSLNATDYRGFTTEPVEIFSGNVSGTTIHTVTYKIAIDILTPAGIYNNIVYFIVTPKY